MSVNRSPEHEGLQYVHPGHEGLHYVQPGHEGLQYVPPPYSTPEVVTERYGPRKFGDLSYGGNDKERLMISPDASTVYSGLPPSLDRRNDTICGMRKRLFWIVLAIILVLLTVLGVVGGVVGTNLASRNKR